MLISFLQHELSASCMSTLDTSIVEIPDKKNANLTPQLIFRFLIQLKHLTGVMFSFIYIFFLSRNLFMSAHKIIDIA